MIALAQNYRANSDPNMDIGMILGTYYLNAKNYVKAENIFRPLATLAEARSNGAFLNNFALTRYYNYQDDALYFVESALNLDPNNSNYQKSYIVIASNHKKFKTAVKIAKDNNYTVDKIDDPSVLYALASSYANIGDKNNAFPYYQKLNSISEDFFEKEK